MERAKVLADVILPNTAGLSVLMDGKKMSKSSAGCHYASIACTLYESEILVSSELLRCRF